MEMTDRFLPGVPGPEIERIFNAAAGNEIESGKFDNPESSAALAANAFGFFLKRPQDLPPLPDCDRVAWPARSLSIEATVRFPWSGGRHPVLDCLVITPSALIGIESKRYEPFRSKKSASFSDAYWRPIWGDDMKGYEGVRDTLRANGRLYDFLDAAQLVKHAFALRTAVHNRRSGHDGLTPILFYLYAEPAVWPKDGRLVDETDKAPAQGRDHPLRQGRRGRRSDLHVLFVSGVAEGLGAPQGWRDSRACSRRAPTFFALMVTRRK